MGTLQEEFNRKYNPDHTLVAEHGRSFLCHQDRFEEHLVSDSVVEEPSTFVYEVPTGYSKIQPILEKVVPFRFEMRTDGGQRSKRIDGSLSLKMCEDGDFWVDFAGKRYREQFKGYKEWQDLTSDMRQPRPKMLIEVLQEYARQKLNL